MVKTVQLGLRIDKDLIVRIERIAEHEGIDKMNWIRRALSTFLIGEEEGMKDAAINDYIHLRIDGDELKHILNKKHIAKDIVNAREDILSTMKKGD